MLPDLFNNTTELKAYLGLRAYILWEVLAKFGNHNSLFIFLVQKDTKWIWSSQQEDAFVHSKELLTS